MRWPRVSILGLIAGVVACGIVFAALRGGSRYWLAAAYTMTTGLLLGAVVLARYRRGSGRAFWFGFAVFGWGMFFLGADPWSTDFGRDFGLSINPNLLTTRLIQWVVVCIRMGTDDIREIDEITANTVAIVHLLVVLALASLGGLFAMLIRKRSRRVASVDVSRRSNVAPSLIILAGLALAGLSTLDRRTPPTSPDYFPGAADHPDSIGPNYRLKWYSRHLRRAGEPSLWLLSRGDRRATIVRFLWLPSFHHSVCVRIDKKGDGARLRATVLDGQAGSGQVAIDRTVDLAEAQWQGLQRHLETAAFWKMPTRDPKEEGGDDGDQCVIEGVDDGLYHIVDRWEPDPAYEALCRSFLDLAGLKGTEVWNDYHSH